MCFILFCNLIALKCDGFEGISIDNPITSAPKIFNHKESQDPLNPVCPVTITFLPLKIFENSINIR